MDIEKHADLPPSWVKQIIISPKDFEKQCPEGKKTIFYKKCKVEKFAPYLLNDNMILKITEYHDNDSKFYEFDTIYYNINRFKFFKKKEKI
jgi:hypothetical protein